MDSAVLVGGTVVARVRAGGRVACRGGDGKRHADRWTHRSAGWVESQPANRRQIISIVSILLIISLVIVAMTYVRSETTVPLMRLTTTIPVGTDPWEVAVAPDGRHAYVANSRSNSVSVIDTVSNSVTATVPVGNSPTGVAVTPDGRHAYVANSQSSSVSVIDAINNSVAATVPVGNSPIGWL